MTCAIPRRTMFGAAMRSIRSPDSITEPPTTSPRWTGRRPDTARSRVDFPAPFAPRSATMVPVSTRRLAPRSTMIPAPYATSRLLTARIGSRPPASPTGKVCPSRTDCSRGTLAPASVARPAHHLGESREGRDEPERAARGPGELGEPVVQAVAGRPEHAGEHHIEAVRFGAERDEEEPELADAAARHAAPVDLELLTLLLDHDAGDVGRRRLAVVGQLDAEVLRAPEDVLLVGHGESVEGLEVVNPAHRHGEAAPRTGAVGDERHLGSFGDGWVVGAGDEAREVAAVAVDESGLLQRELGDRSQTALDGARRVEHDVGAGAVDPEPQVVLCRGGERPGAPLDRLEVAQLAGCGGGGEPAPARGPEADHDVRPSHRHRRFAESAQGRAGVVVARVGSERELEVVMRTGALGEDAGLGRVHLVKVARRPHREAKDQGRRLRHGGSKRINSAVTTTEISNDVRQPSRFEKNTNTTRFFPRCRRPDAGATTATAPCGSDSHSETHCRTGGIVNAGRGHRRRGTPGPRRRYTRRGRG